MDAQVSHIKQHRAMHTVSSPYLWTPNLRSNTLQVFTEKNPRISGPMQVKPMLFKGQL